MAALDAGQMSPSPSSTPHRAGPSRPGRRKQAENWDDDFEFALPARAASKPSSSGSRSRTDTLAEKSDNTLEPSSFTSTSSGSIDLSKWEDSPPPQPPPLSVAQHRTSARTSKAPSPLKIPPHPSYPPPRSSPSRSSGLPSDDARTNPPTPFTSSSQPTQPLLYSSAGEDLGVPQKQRARSGSQSATITKNKLVKRHPSSSFVPLSGRSQWSDYEAESPGPSNRSSPNLAGSPAHTYQLPPPPLPRSKSRELMPPPPAPTNRPRSKSRSGAASKDDVRISQIPLAPFPGQLAHAEKQRKNFWKRLSGSKQAPSNLEAPGPPHHRRRRSSSVGDQVPPLPSPKPPLPPLPLNIRSPSATSTASSSSAASNRSLPSGISSLLRRSTSNLSRKSGNSHGTPPISYPYVNTRHGPSSSSVDIIPPIPPIPIPPAHRPDELARSSSSRSFSRGFHLPSPAPGSPYNPSRSESITQPIPPLPHSSSFPLRQTGRTSDSDTETEMDGKTPRRKKIRPVSALPAPRMQKPWEGEGWQGFAAGNTATHGTAASTQHQPSPSLSGLPQSTGLAAATASTMKTLNTLKKHGRRLSGGFKFGTNSSSSSTESRPSRQLETVHGSPSKPVGARPPLQWSQSDTGHAQITSLNTPTDSSVPPDTLSTSVSDEIVRRKAEKERRRKSWNEFVIPKSVMEKQAELKQGIGAVKLFARGLETLRGHLDTHAELQDKVTRAAGPDELALFLSLESEFSQWWEMAIVLIEVGSTGKEPSQQSPRSRRITMGSDEAQAASQHMKRFPSGMSIGSATAPRKASLPDPAGAESIFGPPRASPESWRASTGRQDLSKRQLEVLRKMLRTPIDRPGVGPRQHSNISSSSTVSSFPASSDPSALVSRGTRVQEIKFESPESGVRMPSPGESNYVVPSATFPSPGSASMMAQPKRRASRAGLAGLKDFLKSLKNQRHPRSSVPPTPSVPKTPALLRSPLSPASPTPMSHTQPGIPYSASRSSFSALGANAGQTALRAEERVRRPNIRNIFRTSSGNWSELVRERVSGESRRSRDDDAENVSLESVDGLPRPKLGRSQSGRSSNSGGGSTSPRAAMFGFRSTKRERQNATRWPSTSSFAYSNVASPPISAVPPLIAPDEDDAEDGPVTVTGAGTETLRPRKRVIGLGLPPRSPDKMDYHRAPPPPSAGRHAAFEETTQPSSRHSSGNKSRADAKEVADEMTVALTPENLPVLLDYVRQCEGRLADWRVRAEGLLGAEGVR